MTEKEATRWRETFASLARYAWVAFPVALIGVMESIMESQAYTPGEKVEMMKWAMEAYNDAVEEAASNAQSMPH